MYEVNGGMSYRFDIHLQGPEETTFFDIRQVLMCVDDRFGLQHRGQPAVGFDIAAAHPA